MLFLFTVVSFPKYEVTALVPFFLFPMLLMTIGEIPLMFLIRKILIVSPFAVFIGIFNPILDTRTVAIIFGIPLSAGSMSFVSILLKFALTISSALLLIATTSFPGVCHALRRLGFPALFVSQLLFLYRYIFVLMEETMRIVRAREMRSTGVHSGGFRMFARLIGVLFLRTVDRAERIYYAMLSRGFQGDVPSLKQSRMAFRDVAFISLTVSFLAFFRLFRITEIVGGGLQGIFR
jgi:cobalt/nickel transport system permease protein